MGYSIYTIAIAAGKRFVGIATDFNGRVSRDLADAALDVPRTWHGVEMKAAGVPTDRAFRVVHVSPELKDAVDHQNELIQVFVDAFGPGTPCAAWYDHMPRGYDPADDGGVNEERLDVIIYKCSGCRFFSTTFSRVQAHFKSSKCAKQVVQEYRTHFIASRVSATAPMTHPANTRAHLEAAMAERIPSGLSPFDEMDTVGIDQRTEYMLSTPDVLHACFGRKTSQRVHNAPGIDISLKIFMHLWGSQAPRRFQTVFTHNHAMYDLRAVDDPSDPSTVDLVVINDAADFNQFMVNLYTALDELAEVVSSAPHVDEQLAANAGNYREALRGKWMTTLDVLDRTPQYERFRKKDPARVKFANALKTAVRGVVKKTLLIKATPV